MAHHQEREKTTRDEESRTEFWYGCELNDFGRIECVVVDPNFVHLTLVVDGHEVRTHEAWATLIKISGESV